MLRNITQKTALKPLSCSYKPAFAQYASSIGRLRFKNKYSSSDERKKYWYIGGGVAFALGTYYVTHLEKVPITGRVRLMTTSKEGEEQRAKYDYLVLMHTYSQNLLPSSHPTSILIRKVAGRLIEAAGIQDSAKWEVNVIQSAQANAFVLPGGKIFIFTGILGVAKDENGIASILSHEIAHVIARHSAEQITWHSILRGLQFMTAFVYDIPYVFSSAILVYGFLFPFSRSCESEADYIGLLLMANGITSYNSACYDPRGATMLWKRMLKQQKGKEPFEYLSTHPNHEKRIDKIEEWMSEALNKYEEARCQNTGEQLENFSQKTF